jgi:hypothetical protein
VAMDGGDLKSWPEGYTGLTSTVADFSGNRYTHLRLLWRNPFLTTTSEAQENNEMVGSCTCPHAVCRPHVCRPH